MKMSPARYDIMCSPGKVEVIPVTIERRKGECPSCPRPHPLTTDPEMTDPRPPVPCNRNPCCACRPIDPPQKPKCYGLKLKLLEDCYDCQMSEKGAQRRRTFYDRWQQYLDRLPPKPNYDYKVYCCDDYVDLSANHDFDRNCFAKFKANPMGQRERTRRNFIWPEVLFQTMEEQAYMKDVTKRRDECPCTRVFDGRDHAYYAEAGYHLYNIEPYSRWHQIRLGPSGFVEGATPSKSRIHPFRKEASFTTPIQEISSGNESPFKEIRDLKMAM